MRKRNTGRQSSVRIIGGRLRGRQLPVASVSGLRPTGDRIRETVFNWLQRDIAQAVCADLFAGTGVLGFEAASRGASKVWLFESAEPARRAICAALDNMQLATCQLAGNDGTSAAAHHGRYYDVVFIDPPFDSGLYEAATAALVGAKAVGPGSLIYVENSIRQAAPVMPANWIKSREKTAGEVRFALYGVDSDDSGGI